MIDIRNALRRVIVEHIAAHNRPDPAAFIATFAPDGLVNGLKREFLGAAAIRAWADKELFGDNVKFDLLQAFDNHGDIVLRGRFTGDFDKTNLPDPLILTYYASLRDDLISQLIIILNQTDA